MKVGIKSKLFGTQMAKFSANKHKKINAYLIKKKTREN